MTHNQPAGRRRKNSSRRLITNPLTRWLGIDYLEDRTTPATLDSVGLGVVTFTAGAGVANNLTVSTDGSTYTITDTSEVINLTAGAMSAGWTGDGTNTVTAPNVAVFSIETFTLDMGDTVNVPSVQHPITVDTGDDTNTVVVGGDATFGAQLILAPVSVLSTGGFVGLTVDDAANTSATTISLFASDVKTIAPADVTFADLASLSVLGGSGGNNVVVTDTPAGVTTTVNAGSGADNANVLATTGDLAYDGGGGDDFLFLGDAGSAAGVGNVAVSNTGGTVALYVDDSFGAVAKTATVTATSVTGLAGGVVSWTAADLASLALNFGDGNDAVTVSDTPAGVTTQLLTGFGNDAIDVANVSTGLAVFGNDGDDTATFDLTTGYGVGVSFVGGDGTDVVAVTGDDTSVTYVPDAATTGTGTLTKTATVVSFSEAESAEFTVTAGTGTLTVLPPNATNVLTLENGTLSDGLTDSLKTSGSTGGVGIVPVHAVGAAIVLDTTTASGTDTITLASANNGHTNTDLTVTTGTEAGDTITVDGVLTFPGTTTLDAKTITFNDKVTNTVTGNTATAVFVNFTNAVKTGEIQDGVDVAAAGATVTVSAGSFPENVSITKSQPLTLIGPNVGTPGYGTRAAEATINPTSGISVAVTAGTVVIDGFELPGGSAGGGVTAIGAATAITVQNNVIAPADSTGTAVLVGSPGTGGAVLIRGNAITTGSGSGVDVTVGAGSVIVGGTGAIDKNVIGSSGGTAVSLTGPGVGATDVVGNTLAAFVYGVSASGLTGTLTVRGNTFDGGTYGGVIGAYLTGNTGTVTVGGATVADGNTFTGWSNAVVIDAYGSTTVQKNTITAPSISAGVVLTVTDAATHSVVVAENVITGAGDSTLGVSLSSANLSATLTDNTVVGFATGVEVDAGATVSGLSGSDFDEATTNGKDLHLTATAGSVTVGGNNAFAGGFFVYNQSPNGVSLTAAGNTVNLTGTPITLATASLAQLYATADRVVDGVDVSGFGHVRLIANNVYVTPNSFSLADGTTAASLQRAVDVSVSGDTVNIQPGVSFTYPDAAVSVTKNSLTLLGPVGGGAKLAGTLSATGSGTFTVTDLATGSGSIASYNQFNLTSTSSTGGTYTLTGTSTQRAVDQPAGPYTLTGVASETVTAGTGNDTFNVTSYATGPMLTADGGNGIDTLTYDATFANDVFVDYANGKITATGRVTVFFTNFEFIQLLNVGSLTGTDDDDLVTVQQSAGGAPDLQYRFGAGPYTVLVAPADFTFNAMAGADKLIVDYSLGKFTQQVNYDGGTGVGTGTADSDSLQLTGGGTFALVAHTLDTNSSGSVQSSSVGQVSYSNLEPVLDQLVAVARTFTFTGGAETITVTDSGGADGMTRIDSTLGELVDFTNPTGSLTITSGTGTDMLTISSIDAAFRASLTIDTDAADTFNLSTVLTLGSATSAGDFTVVNASAVNLGANVSTDAGTDGGNISITAAAVNLTQDVTFDTDAGGTDGTIDILSSIDGARNLTFNSGTGTTTLGGAVGGTTPLTSLTTDVGGTTNVNGGAVTTTGSQTFGDNVAFGADATFTSTGGGSVSFAGTLSGATKALAVNTTGTTTFDGAVTALSLTTDAGGTTNVNGGSVTTTGSQSFGDDVALGADATFAAGTGDVSFVETLTGGFGATVNSSGTTTFNGSVSTASLTTDAGGTTVVNGGSVTTTGATTFNDAVTVGAASTTFTAASLSFGQTLDGASAVTATVSGATTFAGAVGGTTSLTSLTTDAAGTTAVNGGSVKTTGAQSFGDDVALGANATFASTAAGAVSFAGTLTGAFAAVVNTAGSTTFDGTISTASLTTDAGGTTAVNGGSVTTTGTTTFNDPVTVGTTTTFTATDLTFTATLDGAFGVTANASGATVFAGSVGGTTPLTSLSVTTGTLSATNIATTTGVTVDISGSGTISGAITGSGATFVKQGAGSLNLTGASTYTGSTTILGGTLFVNGSITSHTTVTSPGTLSGSGTITGNVAGTGTVAPGNSTGVLTVNGAFGPVGTILFEVNPPATTPGTHHDQLVVNGTVDLSGTTLVFTGAASPPVVPAYQVTTLIANDSTDATTISPATTPAQGATVMIAGNKYLLFYNGGDGNDTVLVEYNATPTTVYVDDLYTGYSNGKFIADADPVTGGNQPAVFGVNAFSTITAGLGGVTVTTVLVNDGTYAEAVNVGATQTVILLGTGPATAGTVTINSLAGMGTVALSDTMYATLDNMLVVGDATSTVYDGVLAGVGGNGTLVKQGAGTLTLTGTNTYGATTISSGTLQIGNAGTTGTLGTGTVTNNGALTFNRTNTYTVANKLSGTGTVNQIGTGTTELSGANDYSGQTNVSEGTLRGLSTTAFGTVAGATVVTGTTGGTSSVEVVGGLTIAEPLTLDTLTGGKIATLRSTTGANTWSGAITVLGTGGFAQIAQDGTGTLDVAGDISGTGSTATVLLRGAGTNGAGATVTGTVTLPTSGLSRTESVLWTINPTVGPNSWTTTDIFTGTLKIGKTNALPVAAAMTLGQAGTNTPTFDLNGFDQTVASLSDAAGTGGSPDIQVTNSSGTAAVFTVSGTASTTYGANTGKISGNLSLVKDGAGTLTLSGVNTYSGTTTVNGGTLQLAGGADRLPTGTAVTIANAAATLDLNGQAQTIASLAGVGPAGTVALGAGALTINGSTTTTYSGVISGSGTVTRAGTGTTTLDGTNTYTGSTSVTGTATLVAGSSAALGTAAGGTSVASGATLKLANGVTIADALSLNGATALIGFGGTNTASGAITLGSAATIASSGGNSLTLSGTVDNGGFALTTAGAGNSSYANVISGAGGLSQTATGTATLTAANTYTGGTSQTTGTLIVDNTTGSGTGTGSVVVTGGVLRVGSASGQGTITGAVSALGGTVEGYGTASGGVSINPTATLSPGVAGPGVLNTGNLSVSGTYTVQLNGTTVGTQYDQTNVTGTVNLTGSTLTGTVGYTPAVGDYYVLIANDGVDLVTGTFTGTTNGGTFTLDSKVFKTFFTGGDGNDVVFVSYDAKPATVYVDDSFAGYSLGFFIADADPQTAGAQFAIFGYNAFASVQTGINEIAADGTVYINDGSYSSENVTVAAGQAKFLVQLGTDNTTAGTVTIGSLASAVTDRDYSLSYGGLNHTLRTGTSGASTTYAGIISGTTGNGTLVKQGTGTFTLTGTNTYGGPTVIEAGTLSVSMVADSGTASNIGAGTAVRFTGTGTLQYTGTTAGANRTIDLQGTNTLAMFDVTTAGETLTLSGTVTITGGDDDLAAVGAGKLALTGTATVDELIAASAGLTANGTITAASVNVGRTTAADGRLTAAAGSGTLTVAGGTLGVSGAITAGAAAGATGTVSQTGGAVTAGSLVVSGAAGASSYSLSSGLLAVSGAGTVGMADTGSLTVSGGSASFGSLAVGGTGAGTVTQTGGTITVTGLLGIGAAGLGTYTITGATTSAGTVTINTTNSAGVDSLAVNAGATLTVGAGGISTAATSPTKYSFTISGGTVQASASFTQSVYATLVGTGAGAAKYDSNGFTVTVTGRLSGADLLKQGTGTLYLNPTAAANTYTGLTDVTAGTLQIGGAFGDGTIVGSGLTVRNTATAQLVTANVIANAVDLTLAAGTFDMNGFSETLGSLAGTGAVTNDSVALVLDDLGGNTTFGGSITGTGLFALRGNVTNGSQTLAGGTYTLGTLTVGQGTLALTSGPTVTVSGTVSVGDNTLVGSGSAITGTLTIDSGSLTAAQIVLGTTAGVTTNGVYTQTGGTATTGGVVVGSSASGNGTFTLTGGLFNLGAGGLTPGAGTYLVTLGGTGPTLRATANNAISTNATLAGTAANALTLDPYGFTVTVAGVLSGSADLTVNSTTAGAVLLNAANTYTGPTTVTKGTLGGTGSVTSDVTVLADGTITGGGVGSVGTFTVKSLTFNGGTYKADLLGNTSDTISTAGTIDIQGPAQGTFVLNVLGGTTTAGKVFTLIDNTAAGAIVDPPFTGAAEGGSTTVNGVTSYYTYNGGLGGNDFTLTATGAYTYNGNGANYVLYRVDQGGVNDLIQLTENGVIVDSRPLASALSGFTLNGLNGTTDTLLVNYAGSGGYFGIPVTFIGGTGGTDDLNVQGAAFDGLVYNANAQTANSTLVFTGTFGGVYQVSPVTITFTDTEATVDVTSALKSVTVNIDPGASVIGANSLTLTGSGGAQTADLNAAFTDLTFSVPSVALTLSGDIADNDTITVASVDASYKAAATINGQGGTDTVTINAALTLGSATSTGALTVTAETIGLNAAVDTTAKVGTGTVSLTGTVVTLAGNISTDGSNVTVVGSTRVDVSGTQTIDTESGNDNAAGAVTFAGSGQVSGVADDKLAINTATTGAAGGAVTLVAFSNGGGDYLSELTVVTSGTPDGIITVGGNIKLDDATGTPANLALTGPAYLTASRTFDTSDNVANGGTVNLSAARLSATGIGFDLTILTGRTVAGGTGGAVMLGTFDNAGGQFVDDLSVNSDNLAAVGGDVTLSAAAQVAGSLTVVGGTINTNATFTAGSASPIALTSDAAIVDGNAGAVNFVTSAGSLTASAVTALEFDTTVASLGVTVTGGNATVRETDALNLTASNVSGIYFLTTGGAVTQTAPITGGSLRLVSGGTATLTTPGNDFGTLAANVTGNLTYTDVNALTVGTIGATVGATATGSLTISTGGALTVSSPLTAMAGTATTSSAGTTTLNAGVTAAGNVSFTTTAAGNLVVNAGVLSSTGSVTAAVAGSTTINANVAAATGITATTAGNVTITATGQLATTAGAITSTNPGNLTVNGPVAAVGGGATLTANAAGGSTILINAAVTGSFARVFGGAGVDSITVNVTGATTLELDALGAGDNYTVNYGSLVGTVAIQDTGASGTDAAFLNGTAGSDTFDVNGATALTVAVGSQKTTYTSKLEAMTIDGKNAADTVNVQYANGPLPASFTVADTGGTAGDVLTITATNLADAIDVNKTVPLRVTRGTESVNFTAGVDTLNVSALDGDDTFTVRPLDKGLAQTVVNLYGGNPTVPVGDTLLLNVVGVTNPVVSNPAIPDGSLTSTSHTDLNWFGIETFPVPLGLGGTFDLNKDANSLTEPGYLPLVPTDTFASGQYAGAAGWQQSVFGFERTGSIDPIASPRRNLLRDGHWGLQGTQFANTAGTFQVVTGKNLVQVTITAGDTYFTRDNVAIYFNGSATPAVVLTTFTAEFAQFTAMVDMTGDADGKLEIRVVDLSGFDSWSLNAIDVRPVGFVAPLVLPALGGTRAADGLTTDAYNGSKAQPNALVTISASNGTLTGTDADPFLRGFQVTATNTGTFAFNLLRPTGNANVTLTARDVNAAATTTTVESGYFLPDTRRIDLNTPGGPTPANYIGLPPRTYTSAGVDALGWVGELPLSDLRTGTNDLLRDVQYNFIGHDGTFHLDLPTTGVPSNKFAVTVTLGDIQATDRVAILPVTGKGTLAGNPTDAATAAGQWTHYTFEAYPNASGELEFRISDLGGSSIWAITSIEARPYPAVQGLSLVSPASPVADGTTTVTMSGTGAVPGSLVTVNTAFGTVPVAQDKDTLYTGVQVLADGSGNFSFQFVPGSSTTSTTALLTGSDVTGAKFWSYSQPLAGSAPASPASRYDFDGANKYATPGFTSVRGNQLYSASVGYGWQSSVLEFERASASASPQNLYRDGAWNAGNGTFAGTFQVKVSAGATESVRVYVGDPAVALTNEKITVEGGATQTVTTAANNFAYVMLTGTDANNDGVFWVRVEGGTSRATWATVGMDFVQGPTSNLPALPQRMAAPAPGGDVGPAITLDALAPLVGEAVRRWDATGLTADQSAALRRVKFQIADLTPTGRFAEHVSGTVTVDDTAGGYGWYLDATPAADDEFVRGPRPTQLLGGVGFPAGKVDLLTVLMHELGHEIGRPDLDPTAAPGQLMTESLGTGERRLPTHGGLAPVVSRGVYVGSNGFLAPTGLDVRPLTPIDVRPATRATTVAVDPAGPVARAVEKPAAQPVRSERTPPPADELPPFGPWVG